MKNVITLLSCAVALVMTSCTLSNEEKAEKLVKETLKDYLYHPDSYEPISTKVDSMFIDVTTIEPIMKISEDIKDLMSKINRCKMKVESAAPLPSAVQDSFRGTEFLLLSGVPVTPAYAQACFFHTRSLRRSRASVPGKAPDLRHNPPQAARVLLPDIAL